MDLADLIGAYLLISGAVHPYGHVAEGNRQDVPMRIDYKTGTEHLQRPIPNDMAATQIHGAGFETQDDLKNVLSEYPKAKENVALANALYKAVYIAGIPDKFAKGMIPGGDIGGMERSSGNRHLKELIAASMLADFSAYGNPKQNWDIGFSTFDTGQPGLKLNYRF